MNIHTPDPHPIKAAGETSVEGKDEVYRSTISATRSATYIAGHPAAGRDGGLIDVHIAMPADRPPEHGHGRCRSGSISHDSPRQPAQRPSAEPPTQLTLSFQGPTHTGRPRWEPAQGHQSVRFQDPGYHVIHGQP